MNEHLVNTKKRMSVALILESGEPREVHHYATLIGYGASAVNGYLAQDTIFELVDEGLLIMTVFCMELLKLHQKWEFQQFNHIGVHRTSKQSV